MFTPKLLAVALAATFTLTACNSSTTKPDVQASLNSQITADRDRAPRPNTVADSARPQIEKDVEFSVMYSRIDRETNEPVELAEGDKLEDGDRYKIDITADRDCHL